MPDDIFQHRTFNLEQPTSNLEHSTLKFEHSTLNNQQIVSSNIIQQVIQIATAAGEIILKHYNTDFDIFNKSDQSPLTRADLESDEYICSELQRITPGIPIISEETESELFEIRKSWESFWLVDPLDGTKEFVKKTGEFTVNIGLIKQGIPVIGVIYVPTKKIIFYGSEESGSYMIQLNSSPDAQRLSVRTLNKNTIDIVASRDHAGPAVQKLVVSLPDASLKSMGSSLKFCLVASGDADVYLRDMPTMEWDTAAAHAIVKYAGGEIYTMDGQVLSYNKESLKNPEILTVAENPQYWFSLINA